MRGCALALHRGPVNVSRVGAYVVPLALRYASTACCALCCYGVVLCCFVSVRRVPPPAGVAVCSPSCVRCSVGCCRCALIGPRPLRALALMQSLI